MKKLAGIFIALIATVVGVSAVFAQSANTITGVTSVSTNSLTTVTVNLSLVNNGTVFLRYRAGSSGNYTSVPSQTVLSTDTSVDFLLERLPLAQSYQIQTSLSSLFSNAVLYSFETPASQFPASDFRHQFDFNETERISLGFGSFRTIPQHVRNIAWDGSQLSIIMGITKHNYGTLDSLTSRGITSIGDDHALVEATILGYGNGVYVAITRQNDTSRVRQVRVYDSPLLFTSSVSNGNLPSNSNHLDVTYDPVGDRWLFLNASTGTSPTRTQDIYALSDLTAPGTATVVGTFTGNQQIQSMVWTTEGLTAAVSVRNAANTAFEIQIVTIPDVTSPNDYISHGTVTQQAVCGSPASGAILEWTGSELIAILTKSCTVGTNTNNRSAMYINLPATIVSSLTAENLELDPRLDVTVQSADESGTTVYVRARPLGQATWVDLPDGTATTTMSSLMFDIPPTLRLPGVYEAEADVNADFSTATRIRFTVLQPQPRVTSILITQQAAATPVLQVTAANVVSTTPVYGRIRQAGTTLWTDLPIGSIAAGVNSFGWTLDRAVYGVGGYEAQVSFAADYSGATDYTFNISLPPSGIASQEVIDVATDAPMLAVEVSHPTTATQVYGRIRPVGLPAAAWTNLTTLIVTPVDPTREWALPACCTASGIYEWQVSLLASFADSTPLVFNIPLGDLEAGTPGRLRVSFSADLEFFHNERFGLAVSTQSNRFFMNTATTGFTLEAVGGAAVPMDQWVLGEVGRAGGGVTYVILAQPGETILARNVLNPDIVVYSSDRSGFNSSLQELIAQLSAPGALIYNFAPNIVNLESGYHLDAGEIPLTILAIDANHPSGTDLANALTSGSRVVNFGTPIAQEGSIVGAMEIDGIEFTWLVQPASSQARVDNRTSSTGGGFGSASRTRTGTLNGYVDLSIRTSLESLEAQNTSGDLPYLLVSGFEAPASGVAVYGRVREVGAAAWTDLAPVTLFSDVLLGVWNLPRVDYPLGDYEAEASLEPDYAIKVETTFTIEFPVPQGVLVSPNTDLTADVSWDVVQGAGVEYQTRWREFEDADAGYTLGELVTPTAYTIENLISGVGYIVEVRALLNSLEGPWSLPTTFMMPSVSPTPIPRDLREYDFCKGLVPIATLSLTPGQSFETLGGRYTFSAFSFINDVATVSIEPPPPYVTVTSVDGHELVCELTEIVDGAAVFKTQTLTGASFPGQARLLIISAEAAQSEGLGGFDLGSLRANACYTSITFMGGGCGATLIFLFPLMMMGVAFFFLEQRNAIVLAGVAVATALMSAIVLGNLVSMGIFILLLFIGGGVALAKLAKR